MNALFNSDWLQKCSRFGEQVVGNVITVVVAALLILTWMLTAPLFELKEHFTRGVKIKDGKLNNLTEEKL
jgi:hypothetical protein